MQDPIKIIIQPLGQSLWQIATSVGVAPVLEKHML